MQKIRLICVGKTKEPFAAQGERIYEKKISRFVRLERIFVREETLASLSSLEIQKKEEKIKETGQHQQKLERTGHSKNLSSVLSCLINTSPNSFQTLA